MYKYSHGGNVHVEPGGEKFIDLSASINPLGPPKQVEEAIRKAIPYCDRYPDSRSTELRKRIAEFENVDADWVFCGNGSSDIIFRLAMCTEYRRGMVLVPSFSDYPRALRACHKNIVFHHLKEKDGFVCDRVHFRNEGIGIVFLCNPNSPTGVLTGRSVIEKLLRQCKETGAMVVVDECFLDFCEDAQTTTAKPLLEEFSNLVVLKAFTKTFALPGIRLGYTICSNVPLIEHYLCSRGPDWPVSNLAQAAGIAALENADGFIAESVAFVAEERSFVKNELQLLGFTVFDSKANFLFFKNPYDFDLKKKLDEYFIRIRSFDAADGLGSEYCRVGLSTRPNNVRFLEAVRKIVDGKGVSAPHPQKCELSSKESSRIGSGATILRVSTASGSSVTEPTVSVMTKTLMIQGTASGVGKSILSIGLCRILQRKGCSVAPFKSQNMSSNAYRLASGLEMAKAQAIAAWACGLEPDVDMNPILLKITGGATDVVVQGKSIGMMNRDEYEKYKRHDAWIPVMDSWNRLAKRHDFIVLEGAGSPVEMNMKDTDIANMNMARRADVPVILVADIDRGGVFASVKGTLSLLSEEERERVKGIVVNKCRGQSERFDEVRECMEKTTGISVLGMIPYLDIDIEDEDSLCDARTGPKTTGRQFDALADELEKHLDWRRIEELFNRKP